MRPRQDEDNKRSVDGSTNHNQSRAMTMTMGLMQTGPTVAGVLVLAYTDETVGIVGVLFGPTISLSLTVQC